MSINSSAPSGAVSYLFACDENYLKHMAAAVESLLYNNRYSGINVYFISDLSSKSLDKVSKIVESYGANFIKVDVDSSLLSGLSQYGYLNVSAYYRLLAPELIDENKILYLDSDLIVRRSLKSLFEIDLSNVAVAAVQDPHFDWHKQLEMDASTLSKLWRNAYEFRIYAYSCDSSKSL